MSDTARTFPLMRQLTSAAAGGTLDGAERWLGLVTLAGEWGVVVVASGGELVACDCWYHWPGGDRVGAAGYLLTAYPQGVTALVDHLTTEPVMINPERLDEATIVAVFPVQASSDAPQPAPDDE